MPYQTLKAEFPRDSSSEAQLRFFLQYAILAPSTHNTQPWLWEIEGDEVVLRADRSRWMPALDPQSRELIMSCGAALQHLCLAIRAFGYGAIVQTFPSPAEPDMLACIRLAARRPATAEDELLFGFIRLRHTHRGHFEVASLPTELLQGLQRDAQEEGAALHFIQDEGARDSLVELIERGDLIQNRDSAIRRDVADWMAPSDRRLDGIPPHALGTPNIFSHLSPLAHRVFDNGPALSLKDGGLAKNAPVLAVLCTAADGPEAWLAAGGALGRVLLSARSQNVWASFFSQPIQIDEGWFQLRQITGARDFPQLVFRLGYAEPTDATPRRNVDAVTTGTTSLNFPCATY
jgi:hypothetical protein